MKDGMLQFFSFAHLPPHLQDVSRPFCATAEWIVQNLPRNPERIVALRKLLEAKDCAVRARLWQDEPVALHTPEAYGQEVQDGGDAEPSGASEPSKH